MRRRTGLMGILCIFSDTLAIFTSRYTKAAFLPRSSHHPYTRYATSQVMAPTYMSPSLTHQKRLLTLPLPLSPLSLIQTSS
ncbi:hypothetical protein BJV78DRAFT_1247767 [Lactifluus subvellereus]|nr:hypothetical protein BJV78DRAFT_1247767 [Lactifluus subvellereus]